MPYVGASIKSPYFFVSSLNLGTNVNGSESETNVLLISDIRSDGCQQ